MLILDSLGQKSLIAFSFYEECNFLNPVIKLSDILFFHSFTKTEENLVSSRIRQLNHFKFGFAIVFLSAGAIRGCRLGNSITMYSFRHLQKFKVEF
jgi:hypothetical protein